MTEKLGKPCRCSPTSSVVSDPAFLMVNLLEETTDAITRSGHAITDVVFIGSATSGHQCDWDRFVELADIAYDNGFGSSSVATDLIIAFSDGAKMWRGEYDGSEWWEFSSPFCQPDESLDIAQLVGSYWPTLAQLADPDDDHHRDRR
jgi:hypothetical protein